MRVVNILLTQLLWILPTSSKLYGLPSVSFTISSSGKFNVKTVKTIAVDPKFAQTQDLSGWTLIPPTLLEFAETFRKDLRDVAGYQTSISHAEEAPTPGIFLTVGNSSKFIDSAGRWTSEGYAIDVKKSGIKITGASPLGVWWGTRTILQQIILHDGKIQLGFGVDAPGWNTRGIFLDGGRHFYPPSFIIEMCSWISFWKQNTFHLHLSDNLDNNPRYTQQEMLDLYARFRLISDDPRVAGLNNHANESYTKFDFDEMQTACAARGVTIVPEIESPGHALVISQWKPKLGLDGALDLLNISHPSTIPTVERIWKAYLPWFQSKVVHIGADEYVSNNLSAHELGEKYNKLVNQMDGYIGRESGKAMRIWATYPPQQNYTKNVYKNVTIQHWRFTEDFPYQQYIQNGYDVVNSDDSFYIVQKYSPTFSKHLNRTLIFHGNPEGGAFAPHIFDPSNATNNPSRDNPRVLGHIAAQWNDFGFNTSTYLEAYYSWRDLLPALADKQWGGHTTDSEYDALFATLQPWAPAQNLDRAIPSKSSLIVKYDFTARSWATGHCQYSLVKDLSGNGYDAETTCRIVDGSLQLTQGCSVTTPLASKGRDYTLSFTIKQLSSNDGPLFTGPDSELRSGNGSSTQVMLVSAGNAFALNYSLPVGEWIDARLIGRGSKTFFSVNGGSEMEFTTKIGVRGDYFAYANMAVVAPLQRIGSGAWEGEMKRVELVSCA